MAAEWARPAGSPDRGGAGRVRGNALVESSVTPERDLSVQLSGWMLLEAAALVSRGG
jgi:predicted alpha-1,6-mannanase (GH76 family)